MPFSALPKNDFRDREGELSALAGLAGAKDAPSSGCVLLLGPRGSGKTELLLQVSRRLFWEEGGPVPFYYRFRRATLKARHFTRDYFSRFVRQFTACIAGDPSLMDNMSAPIDRLISRAPYNVFTCMSEIVEDFGAQAGSDDLPGQLLAAVSAPLAMAECAGRRLVIMLDDFHLARHVYESAPGDMPGVVSIFEESMRSPRCSHIITGSPAAELESIFADDSLRGRAERLRLGPLPAEAAFGLFGDLCKRHGGPAVPDAAKPLVGRLCGNPLYIRNVARAIGRTGCGELSEQAFMESYALEVSVGETAAYWGSVLGSGTGGARLRALALEVLVRAMESPDAPLYPGRLSRALGAPEDDVSSVIEAMGHAGMLPVPGAAELDTVMEDCARAGRMLAAGEGEDAARAEVVARRFGRAAAPMSFEMAIPKASEAELVAARALEQICSLTELPEDDARRLSMAIIEACINAMEHGGHDDRVFLRCSVYPGRIEVAVESRGGALEPEAALRDSDTMPGLGSVRGRGFPLIKRLVDDVRVERAGDRTRVVLVKEIKRAREQNEELHT